MNKEIIRQEIEATKMKLAALEVLAGEDGEEKEAGKADTIKCPTCGSKVLKATGYCLKCKKKIGGGGDGKKEQKKEQKGKKEKSAAEEVVASLDEIADVLEKQGDPTLLKLAYELDKVSDVIEGKKEAATLEGDSDEPYMKEFFKAGLREGDSDESYMKEFNTDTSIELDDKTKKGQLGKDASDASVNLPYQISK